jgi:hypothetical protein
MKKTTVLFVVLLAFSSWLVGQQRTQAQAAEEAPDTTACSFNYSSGAGSTSTAYCLSVNGNIVQFSSPAGYELIDAGSVYEGYGVCDLTEGSGNYVPYFDYARTDSGNWGDTVVSAPNVTTRKFVRVTADGIWQLTQTIKQVKANATSAGSVRITMALKNITGAPRHASVLRMADLDAGDHLNNHFVADRNSAWGVEFAGYGLSLTTNTFVFSQSGFVQTTFSGPDPCNYGVNLTDEPFVGDGSILHFYSLGIVNPGKTKTVVMTYKPI